MHDVPQRAISIIAQVEDSIEVTTTDGKTVQPHSGLASLIQKLEVWTGVSFHLDVLHIETNASQECCALIVPCCTRREVHAKHVYVTALNSEVQENPLAAETVNTEALERQARKRPASSGERSVALSFVIRASALDVSVR